MFDAWSPVDVIWPIARRRDIVSWSHNKARVSLRTDTKRVVALMVRTCRSRRNHEFTLDDSMARVPIIDVVQGRRNGRAIDFVVSRVGSNFGDCLCR